MTENYLILLLAAYALTYALRAGKAWFVTDQLVKIPFFRSMFQCVLCTGTEVGIWGYTALNFRLDWQLIPEALVFGFAAGGFCLIMDYLVNFLDDTVSILSEIFSEPLVGRSDNDY